MESGHDRAWADPPFDEPEGRVWGAGGRSVLPPTSPPPPSVPRRSRPRRPALHLVAQKARPPTLAREQVLPIAPELGDLLPGGLRRGTSVGVTGDGATSLALSLVAEASARGSWVVAVGLDDLGLAAAGELGVALERFALVAPPPPGSWGSVVAALVGSVDFVLVAPSHRVRPADVRRLGARSRERGSVVVHVGDPARWPSAHDLVLTVGAARWQGVGQGHGHLRRREVVVEATGRREAARPRRAALLLPGPDGRLARPTGATGSAGTTGAWAGADIEAGLADEAILAGEGAAAGEGVAAGERVAELRSAG